MRHVNELINSCANFKKTNSEPAVATANSSYKKLASFIDKLFHNFLEKKALKGKDKNARCF